MGGGIGLEGLAVSPTPETNNNVSLSLARAAAPPAKLTWLAETPRILVAQKRRTLHTPLVLTGPPASGQERTACCAHANGLALSGSSRRSNAVIGVSYPPSRSPARQFLIHTVLARSSGRALSNHGPLEPCSYIHAHIHTQCGGKGHLDLLY